MARYTVMLRADKDQFPGAAVERQPGRPGRLAGRAPLRAVGRPVQEAVLSVRPGRRAPRVPGRAASRWRTDARPCCRCGSRRATSTRPTTRCSRSSTASAGTRRRWNLELDLDRFMIVAVGDFNMGAMENKGLNIFNTKYVLANPRVATDVDFQGIEAVVGHEYFHNWSGNRVTCRDWFQLSLKEGLDRVPRPGILGRHDRNRHWARRHPHRPGAHAAPGPVPGRRRSDGASGASGFFRRDQQFLYGHRVRKGAPKWCAWSRPCSAARPSARAWTCISRAMTSQAVTCDDFRMAMADATGRDLGAVRTLVQPGRHPGGAGRGQAMTPQARTLHAAAAASPARRRPGQAREIAVSHTGRRRPAGPGWPATWRFTVDGRAGRRTTAVLELDAGRPDIRVSPGSPEVPTPSILRDFSAPVILKYDYTAMPSYCACSATTAIPVNRWEAGQRLAMGRLLTLAGSIAADQALASDDRDAAGTRTAARLDLDDVFVEALRKPSWWTGSLDPAFRELALLLPSETMIADQLDDRRSARHPPGAPVHAGRDRRAPARPNCMAQYAGQPDPGRVQPGRRIDRQARA